jgi:hypothetical protein
MLPPKDMHVKDMHVKDMHVKGMYEIERRKSYHHQDAPA